MSALISFYLLSFVHGVHMNASVTTFSDVTWDKENHSTAQKTTDTVSSGNVEANQAVATSLQGNIIGNIQGGHQMLQLSSVSNSASFTRHIMCKNHDLHYNPIEPTTIFRPSDTKAECLTTVSINSTIEFKWHYRSNSSEAWVSCYNYSMPSLFPGEYREYHYVGFFNIRDHWPGVYLSLIHI